MEKRFFLATLLSLTVLFVWTIITPRPVKLEHQLNISKTIENKEDISKSASSLPQSTNQITAKTETIETPIFHVEFSNIGGTISKVTIKDYSYTLPIRNMGGSSDYANVEFKLEKLEEREIVYRHETPEFVIRHYYVVSDKEYTIEKRVVIQNRTDMSRLVNLQEQALVLDMSNLNSVKAQNHDQALLEYVISSEGGMERKSSAFKFSPKEQKEAAAKVLWVGFRNRYFCAINKPLYDTDGYTVNPLNDKILELNVKAKEVNIAPKKEGVFSSLIFVGPEKNDLLAKYQSDFEDIKRYYRLTLFDTIAKIIYSLLNMIYKFIPNWGVSVILISIFIYLAMYPLTLRSMVSMRKMQELQPKVAALREKHKDNPQKMNIEMMELYKKYKVNPLGGCLPVLLQMPVFIGLYQVLWRSVSFKGAHFLWIKDLSEPDKLAILPFSLPFLGNEFNLLPIIMIVVMMFQQKLTSQNMGSSADPNVILQQKMMTIIMPIFIGVIFYRFPSGLTLYFTVFYALSTLMQWKMTQMKSAPST